MNLVFFLWSSSFTHRLLILVPPVLPPDSWSDWLYQALPRVPLCEARGSAVPGWGSGQVRGLRSVSSVAFCPMVRQQLENLKRLAILFPSCFPNSILLVDRKPPTVYFSVVALDCTQFLSFLLVIERLERARCATARETGVSKVRGSASRSLQSLNYCGRAKKGTACSLWLRMSAGEEIMQFFLELGWIWIHSFRKVARLPKQGNRNLCGVREVATWHPWAF